MIGNVLNDFFKELGRKRDYEGLRACIVSLVRSDPTFESGKFDEVEDYLSKNDLLNVFKPYAQVPGEPKDRGRSEWDESYFSNCAFALRENFSRERLAHVKEVGEYVYRDKPTPGKEEAAKKAQAAQGRTGSTKSKTAPKKPESPTNLKKYLPLLIALLLVIVVVVILVKKKA